MGERIAVLGAGPMGLAVAYQLTKLGHKPVVFEADDRVGGMTATFDFSGLEIERYYHFHCTSDHAFLDLLDELGIANRMRWKRTKMGYWFKGRLQPWGNPIALLRFRGLGLLAKLRYGVHVFLATKRTDWKPLDGVEATHWIKQWVGKEAYDVLWRRLFEFKFYHYSENLSAAWIWSRIRRIGRSRYNMFAEKLGHLEGGSDTLLRAMKSSIEECGGVVKLSSSVSEVCIVEGRVTGIRLADGEFIAFDKVVSTIPLPYVPKVAPGLPIELLEAYRSLKNIAVVCVIIKLRRPVSENFWVNINDPEMDIPGLVEYSNLRDLRESVVYVPFYMPGDNPKYLEDNAIFIAKVKRYLQVINPRISEADFIDARASRYRFAQPVCEPRFLDRLPPAKTPVDGLWIADTSHYYPEDRGISESIEFGRRLARFATTR
jgi:protoporphyrinogen oxidase